MASPAELRRDLLLSEYVACFEKFGQLSEYPWIDAVAGMGEWHGGHAV